MKLFYSLASEMLLPAEHVFGGTTAKPLIKLETFIISQMNSATFHLPIKAITRPVNVRRKFAKLVLQIEEVFNCN